MKNAKFNLYGSEKCQLANLVVNNDWLIVTVLQAILHAKYDLRKFGFWATVCKTVRPMQSDRLNLVVNNDWLIVTVLQAILHAKYDLQKFGFWATVCKTVRPMQSDRLYPVCPVLSVKLVYCGQTVGWIKMPLGMEVCLGPGHIVLDGDPARPPLKGAQPPNFRPMSVVANGWMDQDASW